MIAPLFASQTGDTYPEVEAEVAPCSIAGVLVIVCAQVGLGASWHLVDLIKRNAIFTPRSLRSVTIIALSGATATSIAAAVMFHLLGLVGVGDPGVVLGLAACLAVGFAFVVLMIVMRGLLHTAITDRTALDEVI